MTKLQLTNEQVDRMLGAAIPGGSHARDWFLPHEQPRGLANVRDVVRAMVDRLPSAWRCFHCDEVFTTEGSARDHFGLDQTAMPGCVIDQVAIEEGGKPERGRGLLMALRKAELELDAYRQEDTELHRFIHGLQTRHHTELMREEEKGYARGLADGLKEKGM